jgi:mRNA-degrading endonuclease RelE of RelBE toxin-antitoxin system
MEIFQTPDFAKLLKTLAKPKYSNLYGTVKQEIQDFFSHYSSFDQVWQKSYMLYENAFIRINKIRLENELQNSGKSGGFRLIVICDKRTQTVCLLYLYPKVGPLGMESTNLEFAKKMVINYSEVKGLGLLKPYTSNNI